MQIVFYLYFAQSFIHGHTRCIYIVLQNKVTQIACNMNQISQLAKCVVFVTALQCNNIATRCCNVLHCYAPHQHSCQVHEYTNSFLGCMTRVGTILPFQNVIRVCMYWLSEHKYQCIMVTLLLRCIAVQYFATPCCTVFHYITLSSTIPIQSSTKHMLMYVGIQEYTNYVLHEYTNLILFHIVH